MRLLFDQNLSPRLLTILADLYSGSTTSGTKASKPLLALMNNVAVSGPSGRMRARGVFDWVAVQFVKTFHEPFDIGR